MTGLSSGPALCSKAFKAHHNRNLEHAATPGGVGAADKEDRELRRRYIACCGVHKYVDQLLLLLGSEGGDTLPKYADHHLHAGMGDSLQRHRVAEQTAMASNGPLLWAVYSRLVWPGPVVLCRLMRAGMQLTETADLAPV